MPPTRRVALLAAVLVLVGLAGCAGLLGDDGSGVDPDDYDADELQADAVAATDDAETYAFTYSQTLTPRSDQGDLTLGVDGEGRADEPAERSYLEFRTWIGQPQAGVDAEAYHDGSTLHDRSEGGNWSTTQAASGYWAPTDQDVALLEGADVTVNGTGTVDGRETVVLAVDPDGDDAITGYGLDQALVDDLLDVGVEVESATVRQHVSPEDPHRILRTEIDLTFVVERTETEESVVDAELSTTYDYDADGPVELPAELAE